ncbi:MAG: methylated-DNA--[protein]-cysteine S-methyltransferase [Pseudomonadota bacterium]|nr:methylated-DNA--[protein]-cysteine S-methyltransferase [Pseudomonadota bacterium]
MPLLSFNSPIGPLTVHEQRGAITKLSWERETNRDVSSLLFETKNQIQEYLNGTRTNFNLPQKPYGSEFQLRVWQEVAKIPYGQTASYRDLASKLSSSPRPVGTACGKNPIPIIIPCHRIIAKTGHLTGYSGRGGLDTKRLLLKLEKYVQDDN